MNKLIDNLIWLERWERNKEYNVAIGFDNHTLLKGYVKMNDFSCFEQFPSVEFFLELEKIKPKLYSNNNVIEGSIICYIESKRYEVIYYYNTGNYLIIDDNDTIVKKLTR